MPEDITPGVNFDHRSMNKSNAKLVVTLKQNTSRKGSNIELGRELSGIEYMRYLGNFLVSLIINTT